MNSIEQRIFPQIEDLIRQSSHNLAKLEEEMGEAVGGVQKFYRDAGAQLNANKEEHLQHYQQIWKKMRHMYWTLRQELTNIKQYMLDRTCEITERKQSEALLYNRNVAELITRFQRIDTQGLTQYQGIGNKGLTTVFAQHA